MTLTARAFLFESPDVDLASRGLLAELPAGSAALRSASGREVNAATLRLLDFDLGAVLLGGWVAASTLVAAGRSTLADPARTELVELAAHRISAVHRPFVDVLFDGRQVASLSLEITMAFDVKSLLATVRMGKLVDIECGRCEATVSLSCAGAPLAKRSAQFDAPLIVKLGQGVPLVKAAA